MDLKIDGKSLRAMSIDEIGATLQQIASELSIRGKRGTIDSTCKVLLLAFNEVEEAVRTLRRTTGPTP